MTVWGTGIEAVSSTTGAFTLAGLPTGSYTLEGRALGYQPVVQTVDIVPGDAADVVLDFKRVAALDTFRIIRSAADRSLEAFNARRRSALGRYLGPEELQRRGPFFRTADLLRQINGVFSVPNLGGDAVLMRAGARSYCRPTVWVDGSRVLNGNAASLDAVDGFALDFLVPANNVRAVEVYRSRIMAPAQFSDLNDCGVLVFWTGGR